MAKKKTSKSKSPKTIKVKDAKGNTHTVKEGSKADQKYAAERAAASQPATNKPSSNVDYTYNPSKETAAQYLARTQGSSASSSTPSSGGVDQNYYVKPGESAAEYNKRVAAYNASRATPVPETTGDPILDQTLKELETYLGEMKKRGKVLNPNIELDAETIAKFTSQAEAEINPYYAEQLKIAREALLRDAEFSRDSLLRDEQQRERQYRQDFRDFGEMSADQGFALSGLRQRGEEDLALDTQTAIEQNRRNLEFDLGSNARRFAQAYGTRDLPIPEVEEMPSVVGGETGFTRKQAPKRQLYQLDPGVYDGLVGSEEFNRRAAVKSRASQLEEAFRGSEALKQQRSLIL